MKTKKILGYTLELSPFKNTILSITSINGRKIKLMDQIISNGNVYPKGEKGQVIEICEPYTEGNTSDIILCVFSENVVCRMKFKDID